MEAAGGCGGAAERGPDAVVPDLIGVVRETRASVGAMYLLEQGECVLRLAALTGLSWRIAAPWARVALTDRAPVSDAVRERRAVWLGSPEELARHYPRLALILPHRFLLAAAPVASGATAWGGLVLQWPGSHPPRLSAHETEAIHRACTSLAGLLSRAAADGHPVRAGARPRLLPPSRPRTVWPAEAQAAADFAERLPGGCCTLDVDGRIAFVTTAAAELLGAGVPELLGARLWQVLPWLDAPAVEDHYRGALISRQATSFTALRPPDRWLAFHLYADGWGVSVRIVPAEDATDPSGVLRPAPPAEPGRGTGLYQLMHLAATLTEAVGVQDVVEQAADQLLPALGAQALALMAAEEGRLRIMGYRGWAAALMDRFDGAPLASSVPAARVLATGIPSFFSDWAELKRAHPPVGIDDGMSAWAFLPLITSGRPVGSLVLGFDRPRPFTVEERTLLTSVAGLVAQALDRARLYDSKDRLAHALQAGLLPQVLPRIAGLDIAARYLPAGRGMGIGGDFYDLIRLTDRCAAAAIGDVQGHNVNAAVLMGQVRTAVHATAGAPPGEVLARTNRVLTDLDSGLFTSCLYVHLDLARHRARLATAGHPPPLLRHPCGRTEVLDLPPGLLLGIDPAADYPSTEIPLPPGAVLALYTDGLVESPGVDLGQAIAGLGDRLADAGDAAGGGIELLADTLVRRAEQSAARSDDVALLLIHPHRDG
ncbi:SpoIIE family protein phosphatase [Streptomyces sp. NPDC002574]|uniref:SpoIIE family protein phosphatase n=1 Tax=Streptomyces sp. NPDC002574 TaxID=3364652 RepID=UPI003694E479